MCQLKLVVKYNLYMYIQYTYMYIYGGLNNNVNVETTEKYFFIKFNKFFLIYNDLNLKISSLFEL